jgi:hypothetical protein
MLPSPREATMQHKLDDFGVIRCINFVRTVVREGADPRPALASGPAAFVNDDFMCPVLDNDALLCHEYQQSTG